MCPHMDAFETTDLLARTMLPPLSFTPVALPPSISTSSTCAFIMTFPAMLLDAPACHGL